jgi:hypothetical protein
MTDTNSGPGWYEVIHPRNATTCIALVREDGSLYLPEGPDLTAEEFAFAAARGRAHRLVRADEPLRSSEAEEHLARRLAHNHGWLDDDSDWERKKPELRRDYLDLARETLTVLGGPTETHQRAAALAAEVRELTRQRDRYRKAWRSACHRATKWRTVAPAKGAQPVTVHDVPLPGSNGISSCCGRPPCQFVGERLSRHPDEVTCTGDATTGETAAPCPAALLPRGTEPAEPCVVKGPHDDHVTAQGRRWNDVRAEDGELEA